MQLHPSPDAAPRYAPPELALKWNPHSVIANAAPNADGPVTFILSTDDVDRHGDIVSADGWRLDAYRENPVLLWAHDYRRPAIGRAVALWIEPHRLMARMEFAPSAFAQEVAALYAAGFQWGVSVGFRPIRCEERRDPRTGLGIGLRYLEQELLEVSAVPVPANRNALRRSAPGGLQPLIGALREARRRLWADGDTPDIHPPDPILNTRPPPYSS